jgi:hypothetical protein
MDLSFQKKALALWGVGETWFWKVPDGFPVLSQWVPRPSSCVGEWRHLAARSLELFVPGGDQQMRQDASSLAGVG